MLGFLFQRLTICCSAFYTYVATQRLLKVKSRAVQSQASFSIWWRRGGDLVETLRELD